ncbi:serine protease [Streptomyces arenae]|nr:serine protease [Streptomyces arenae]
MPGENPGQNPGPAPGHHPGKRWARGPGQGWRKSRAHHPGNGPGPTPGNGPGTGPGKGAGKTPGKGHRPHAARRRGRRLTTLLFGLLVAAILVLSGVGLGTVSATVIGMSKLAEMQKAAQKAPAGAPGGAPGVKPPASAGAGTGAGASAGAGAAPDGASGTSSAPGGRPEPGARPPTGPVSTATLGVEAVDAPGGAGALLVGVHIPGPGYTAGLVRGDTLLAVGRTRVTSAAGLAAAVGAARPGKQTTLTVRHEGGGRQILSVRSGVVT